MKYSHVVPATFLERPNRFVARVRIGEAAETVPVKNTGRCGELLIPGAEVYLAESRNPARKTKYDLIAVRKENGLLFNIDSQAPNQVVKEWLERRQYDRVIPEFTYGESRIDFYMERGTERFLMEVKGCTLEIGGIGYFPDAPTERGVKHLRELARAAQEGFHAMLAFVIQVDGVTEVRPNIETHPEFGLAMEAAEEAGVEILFLPCHVEPNSIEIVSVDGKSR
jgi:sugar fermentation stimulation protein A